MFHIIFCRLHVFCQAAISRRLSDVNGKQSGGDDCSTNEKTKFNSGNGCFVPDNLTSVAPGVTIHEKRWTDGTIPLDSISIDLARLGKVNKFNFKFFCNLRVTTVNVVS